MSNKIQGQIRVKGKLTKYVKGRISGIIEGVICRIKRIPYATVECVGDTFFRVDCTERQFEKIRKIIERKYSDMYKIEFLTI